MRVRWAFSQTTAGGNADWCKPSECLLQCYVSRIFKTSFYSIIPLLEMYSKEIKTQINFFTVKCKLFLLKNNLKFQYNREIIK